MRGYKHFHNPETGTRGRFLPGTEPDGFIRGSGPGKGRTEADKERLRSINKGRKWWFNPATGDKVLLSPDQKPAEGFIPGSGQKGKTLSAEARAKQSQALKGRLWFHSPATNEQALFKPGSEPSGYIRGKAPKT
jgi:hypothetical protein